MDTRVSLVALVLLTSAACAGGQQTGDTGRASPQQEAARQSAEYRTQANSLREMADRRQLEADLLAREVGPNDPGVEKKRRLAEELRAAAVDAENKAHELGRQVPHGMVQ
ncbi:MAG TPA: hypothetical protein VFR79_05160 [Nitrospira sp.]|nr:hypothetical protein [Nitrospira sp.]